VTTPARLAAVVAALAFIVSGCGVTASSPPPRPPAPSPPPEAPLDPLVSQVAHAKLEPVAAASVHRRAEEMTVRIRNISCDGVALGSGFAITPHVLVTNRHVLAGATDLQVDTWDGHDDSVSTAKVGVLGDLGIATTAEGLPHVARFGRRASSGDVVTVVGYPLGGPLEFAKGVVVDRVDGRPFGINGAVLRITARVEHGNSGGPVLDSRGRVVAVVFGIETATGLGLAIPNDTLVALARAGGFEEVPACGSG
jgi:S1-C subfamily serine protease